MNQNTIYGNKYATFVQYLDNYKKNQVINYYDCINISQNIYSHYLQNGYNDPTYCGIIPPPPPPSYVQNYTHYYPHNYPQYYPQYHPQYHPPNYQNNNNMYYQLYNQSSWNQSYNPLENEQNQQNESNEENGSNGQNGQNEQNESNESNEPNKLSRLEDFLQKCCDKMHKCTPELKVEPSPVKIYNVSIDVSVSSLPDLLKIIDQYEYKSDTEYNIDLKALHNIKDELNEMNNMIGMTNFKTAILDQLLYFVQNLHIGKENDFKHTVICGPPGTGKTEIAKIIGKMYSKLGILKNNIFKKVTRSDLIAGYLGQTAIKTKKVITECLGGCMFIDEAYSLAHYESNDSFSKECIDTLCEALSDHKDDLMVIVAGYETEMNETFFKANQGLDSRFIWRFKVDDYTFKELFLIFNKKIKENEWELVCDDNIAEKWFEQKIKDFKHFGRDMELLFSYTKISHGRRIYGKSVDLRKKITLEDLDSGYQLFIKNLKKSSDNKRFINDMYV